MGFYHLQAVLKEGTNSNSYYFHDDLNSAKADAFNKYGIALKDATTSGVYDIVFDEYDGSKKVTKQFGMGVKCRLFSLKTVNGVKQDPVLSSYDTEREALGNYNTRLASIMNDQNCEHAIILCIDEIGDYLEAFIWDRDTANEP